MVLEILYSQSQIPNLTRKNILCLFLGIASSYYVLKWSVGLLPVILLFVFCSCSYLFFVNFCGNVSLKKCHVNQDIKPHRKAVLITGCDTGFGFNIAKRLGEKGFQVFACCLHPFQNGGKELSEKHGIHTLGMDVSKEEDVILALDFVKHHLGGNKLWAIINNAGISKGSEIEITPMDLVEDVLNVNLLGTIRVTKAFIPLLRSSKGRVVNVASAGGRFVMPGFLPYSISKNAIICFSDGLRLELSKFGISVITIEPWVYRTRLSDPSKISKRIEEQLTKPQEREINAYRGSYVKRITQNSKNIFGTLMNNDIDEVINVMEDAVSCKNPPYNYRPGSFNLNVILWLMSLLPKPVVDYVICYFVFKCG